MPPELFGNVAFQEMDALSEELRSGSAWDIAVRYHEFKAKPSFQIKSKHIRELSARVIVEKARAVLGSVVHPTELAYAPLTALPEGAEQVDFDVEETLEQSPLSMSGRSTLRSEDLWMSCTIPRRQSAVLAVDTSLSMTGEKLALTAVALAVVLLQFPQDPIGIIAFENEAKVIKEPFENLSVFSMVERFLDVPAQGYTHLEDGLLASLKMVHKLVRVGAGKPPSTVVLTDGKYTAGKDPAYVAAKFPHLVVLKMGNERGSDELCRELAQKGKGALREVGDLQALPTIMYGVVKDLLRGRSLA